MAPNYESAIASDLVGSMRVGKAQNALKHGSGTLFVENSLEFFGNTDQHLKTSNSSVDLYLQSAKDLKVHSEGQQFATSGTAYNVDAGSALNLKAKTGQALVQAQQGDVRLKASSSIYEEGQHRFATYAASIQDTANSNVSLTATTGSFTATSNGVAKVESQSGEAQLWGKTLANVKADATKLQSTAGKTEIIASTDVEVSGVNCSLTSTAKSSLAAPACDIIAATEAKVDAPLVSIGATSDNVNLSSAGKTTNVQGNCVISGDLTVSGTTTQVNTEQVLIKDNMMVLNDAAIVDKDSGLLFKRNAADSQAIYWDESDDAFVLGSTESAHDASQIVHKDYSVLKAKSIVLTQSIKQDGFYTTQVELDDNASTPVVIPELTKTRGCVELQVTSLNEDGACWMYKLVKSSTLSSSFSSFGVHQSGSKDEELAIKWDSTEHPKVYHKVPKNDGAGLKVKYDVKVLSVSSI